LRKVLRRLTSSWILLPVLVLLLGAGVGIAAAVLAGGDDSGDGGSSETTTAAAPRPTTPAKGGKSFLSQVIPPPAGSISGAKPASRVAKLVESMPLKRKVAQLMIVGFRGTDAQAPVLGELKRYDWGGLMVTSANDGGDAALKAMTTQIQMTVQAAKHVQPLLMIVQQGGEFSAIPELPPELAPSETESPEEAAKEARTTGRTFQRLGLNGIFAPSLEVGPEDGGAMGERAYSDDAEQVAEYATATVPAYARSGLMPAAGRFPGLGAANTAPEEGPPNVGLSVEELRTRDLVPYSAAIRAGVPAIVVGHGLYTTDDFVTPASQSKAVVSTLLRGYLGFRGLAIADDLTQASISTTIDAPEAAIASIAAGIDMVYVSDPSLARPTYDALLKAAKSGKLPASRIDEALTRSLTAKNGTGLLTKKVRKPRSEAVATGP
jgi:beta-N-acetylhexosaminidase